MDGIITLAKNIELVVFDVDGVLTDGRIVYDSNGCDSKFFNVKDGLGVSLLKRYGIEVAFMSAKGSEVIRRRAKDCMVEYVFENVSNKRKALLEFSEDIGISLSKVCFLGDDLVDIGAMLICGFPVAVADAIEEVKKIAKFVTNSYGGRGAVRELSELILKAKGYWDSVIESFS